MNFIILIFIISSLAFVVFIVRWLNSGPVSEKLEAELFELLEKEPMTLVQLYKKLKYKYPAGDLRRALDYNSLFKSRNGTWYTSDAPEPKVGE